MGWVEQEAEQKGAGLPEQIHPNGSRTESPLMGRNIIDMVTAIIFFALVSVVAITITLTAWCVVLTMAAVNLIVENIERIK